MALLTACAGLEPVHASPKVPSYSYQLEPASEVLMAGEALHFEWAPRVDPNFATASADVTLCFAFYGPWPDVATLKRESTSADRQPTCPPAGLPGPTRPGFYTLRQISLFGPVTIDPNSTRSGALTSDRVVEVRAR